MRSLDEWLAQLAGGHPRAVDLGLDRVRTVAETMQLAHPPCMTWIVGGTNGKGSTVAFIESLLAEQGLSVGAFTSPHLVRYNERIRVDRSMAHDDAIVAAFAAIDAARGAISLTFFEFNLLAALWIFRERRVDAAVLEVGLGGRLDAANLIDADVAVLTSVGMDHREWLGNTLEEIGREKAGIFRAGRPAIVGSPGMPRSVHVALEALRCDGWIPGRDFGVRRESQDGRWDYLSCLQSFDDLPAPALSADVQYDNAAAAISAVLARGIDLACDTVARALTRVSLPGRLQIVAGEPEWILDVAHNEPAARTLARNLAHRGARGRTIAVAGFLDDKDVEGIGTCMKERIDDWILATLPAPRGLDAGTVASRLAAVGVRATVSSPDVASACAEARRRARRGDRIVVFGSFLVVGPALDWLGLY